MGISKQALTTLGRTALRNGGKTAAEQMGHSGFGQLGHQFHGGVKNITFPTELAKDFASQAMSESAGFVKHAVGQLTPGKTGIKVGGAAAVLGALTHKFHEVKN